MVALDKIKKLDAADPAHRLSYSLIVSSARPYSTVAAAKAVGPVIEVSQYLPAAVLARYRAAGLRLDIWTGRSEADYARITALRPDGIVVDDVARYRRWAADQ